MASKGPKEGSDLRRGVLAAARNPDTIAGMCEDYRAAATLDMMHDRTSRADGRRVQCPLMVLWGAKGRIGGWYDPVKIWRDYCDAEVTGAAVDSGHYLPEETPGEVLTHQHFILAGTVANPTRFG